MIRSVTIFVAVRCDLKNGYVILLCSFLRFEQYWGFFDFADDKCCVGCSEPEITEQICSLFHIVNLAIVGVCNVGKTECVRRFGKVYFYE